ncbi:Riboflavin transport system permease protein RibX [Paraburkholderia hiiakae]|uniref:Riboflavin transport system permease protein RibX n=1 Tax=Paraburkholderia hiiakae TaxID=1081782 RepID=A0ABM8NM65_9BURK|nr:ABC transporter permease [Paraburkholderia hiiakae]CAD6532954.1 Riboflavin transport system permease protein RibX [Paraburkholderia hiiakae]
MRPPPRSILRLLLVLAILAAWEGLVRLLDVPAYIIPAPSSVLVALYRGLASTLYVRHLWTTLVETLLGFAVGSVVALVLGTLVALSRRCEYFLYPFILMFQAMPKVALAPLVIIWFGLGLGSKVAQASLTAFFPLMVNTIAGLRSADEDRIALMRSLDASELQIFTMLRMPSAMPYLFAGFEIAMMLSLIGAIVAEFVGAQKGLGVLIMGMTYTMDVAGQFSVLVILSLLGLFLNTIIVLVRRRLLFWDTSPEALPDVPSEGAYK